MGDRDGGVMNGGGSGGMTNAVVPRRSHDEFEDEKEEE